MCDHISSFYINEINLSEAIASGKQLGIPIPKHFLLAGIEVGEQETVTELKKNKKGSFNGSLSILFQRNMDSIFQTLRSIIIDFLNKTI